MWGEVPHCVDRDTEALTSRDSAGLPKPDISGKDKVRAGVDPTLFWEEGMAPPPTFPQL